MTASWEVRSEPTVIRVLTHISHGAETPDHSPDGDGPGCQVTTNQPASVRLSLARASSLGLDAAFNLRRFCYNVIQF